MQALIILNQKEMRINYIFLCNNKLNFDLFVIYRFIINHFCQAVVLVGVRSRVQFYLHNTCS